MSELPEKLFSDPVWHALQSGHRHLALAAGAACRYPADVAPFAAVAAPGAAELRDLHSLLAPKEAVWLFIGHDPDFPELHVEAILSCVQMVLPPHSSPAAADHESVTLSQEHAGEMVALTDIAFPGFFRIRTCAMGTYYGIRSGDALVAMSGERMLLHGYPEISAVCTHPAHRGRGYAASLVRRLAREHREQDRVSWLHVGADNRHAIELYARLGFEAVRTVTLRRVRRAE